MHVKEVSDLSDDQWISKIWVLVQPGGEWNRLEKIAGVLFLMNWDDYILFAFHES